MISFGGSHPGSENPLPVLVFAELATSARQHRFQAGPTPPRWSGRSNHRVTTDSPALSPRPLSTQDSSQKTRNNGSPVQTGTWSGDSVCNQRPRDRSLRRIGVKPTRARVLAEFPVVSHLPMCAADRCQPRLFQRCFIHARSCIAYRLPCYRSWQASC